MINDGRRSNKGTANSFGIFQAPKPQSGWISEKPFNRHRRSKYAAALGLLTSEPACQ